MPPIIDRFSPSAGWPGGPGVADTLVVIHGRYFHPTPEMDRNRVSFATASGGRVDAPVEWASVDEVDYRPDGMVLREATAPDGLNNPSGAAVDAAGNLYLADTEQHRVLRMTPAGVFSAWGSHGSGPGQFDRPTGVAVDGSGFVYVTDSNNHRIQKFDAGGGYVTAWGSHGSGLGQFDAPVDVDVTTLGGQTFVYVADSNNHRVVRTDADGGHPANFLAPADTGRILGVCAPRLFASVYATDPANRRLLRWAWFGPYTGAFGPPGPHTIAPVERVEGQAQFLTMTGGFMSFEVGFEILFDIPPWLTNAAGDYRFEVTLNRSGVSAFHDERAFTGAFSNRLSYRIVSSPVSHLRVDGSRVGAGPMYPALFYLGPPQHALDWLDCSQLYSGYVNYNRLYPLRYSLGDVSDWGVWVNNTMADGINSNDEVRDMLLVLERTRRRLNEDTGACCDFMLGIVDRDEVHQDWAGITSDAYRSALISVSDDPGGSPAYDVGVIIGHELLHQHGVDEQSARELAATSKQA